MRPIPEKMRKEMSEDLYMKKCCLSNSPAVEWHHVWKYAGQQINEKWAIMPLSKWYHIGVHSNKEVQEKVQYLSLLRATEKDLEKYPKKDWKQLFNYLKDKHGKIING